MPRLEHDVISLLDASDSDQEGTSDEANSEAISADLTTRLSIKDEYATDRLESSRAASSQYLDEEEYDGLALVANDEAEYDGEEVQEGKLPFDNDKEDLLTKRQNFVQLLQDMEFSADLKRLYPTSLLDIEPGEICDEKQVLRDFIKIGSSFSPSDRAEKEDLDFEELEMQNFALYRGIEAKGFNGQLEYIHNVSSDVKSQKFLLDGTICCDRETRRVIGLEIIDVSFGGLMDVRAHTTSTQIWVQTRLSKKRQQTWYRLSQPATEYELYFEESLWVIDFAKHVLEYLNEASENAMDITSTDFLRNFWARIETWHGHDVTAFQSWHARCGSVTDFRKLLIRHGSFVWNQAYNQASDGLESILEHTVWDDLALADRFDRKAASKGEQTIVTESIGTAFVESFSDWGPRKHDLLSITPMSPEIAAAREQRRILMGLPRMQHPSHTEQLSQDRRHPKISYVEGVLQQAGIANQPTQMDADALVGKVVIVRIDDLAGDGKEFEYAWISETISRRKLHAVWLALPNETICDMSTTDSTKTFYLAGNELFFTTRCTTIALSKVVGNVDAAVFGREPVNEKTIRIRQLYKREEDAFVTAKLETRVCNCQQTRSSVSGGSAVSSYRKEDDARLKTLSLFCGAGLLDFALKESGCMTTKIAIDHSERPVRSHAMNSAATNEICDHKIESVNCFLKRVLSGKETLPHLNCITAGCPCQGFSKANKVRFNADGQRNCSMLAHTLSWIDLVLPEMVIIENVPSMDFDSRRRGLSNACSQAISCLVALGYQTRKMILNGSSYGNSTTRRRLFLIAAAPNCFLPEVPVPTHSDDPTTGLQPIQTVRRIFHDLPKIHNDIQVNLKHPDHLPVERLRQLFNVKVSLRSVVERIPKRPGMGLVQAYQQGCLSKQHEKWYFQVCSAEKRSERSLTLRRIKADGLLPTIVTVISPLCARIGGNIIHYEESRTVTLEELRLAQGIPGWFLLVGNLRDQVAQVGNGVAWQMARAIGGALAKAWKTTTGEDGPGPLLEPNDFNPPSQPHYPVAALRNGNNELSPRNGSCEPTKGKFLYVDVRQVSVGAKGARERGHRSESSAPSGRRQASITVRTPTPLARRPPPAATSQAKIKQEYGGDSTSNERHRSTSSAHPTNTIEELEISEHESLDQHPDGTVKYRHHQRAIYTKTTLPKESTRKPIITVEIPPKEDCRASVPPKKKLEAATPAVQDDNSDDDVIFTGSRVIKKDDVQRSSATKRRRASTPADDDDSDVSTEDDIVARKPRQSDYLQPSHAAKRRWAAVPTGDNDNDQTTDDETVQGTNAKKQRLV